MSEQSLVYRVWSWNQNIIEQEDPYELAAALEEIASDLRDEADELAS